MSGRRERKEPSRVPRVTVPFRVMKFSPDHHEIVLLRFGEWTTSTAADLQDGAGKKITAIRQPNARYAEPWDEIAFREETRHFVGEFNARRIAAGERAVARIIWLVRGRPDGAEDVT